MAGNWNTPKRWFTTQPVDVELLAVAVMLAIVGIVGIIAGYESVATGAVAGIAGISYAKTRA